MSRSGLMGVVEKVKFRGSPSFSCLCVELECASFSSPLDLCSVLVLCQGYRAVVALCDGHSSCHAGCQCSS